MKNFIASLLIVVLYFGLSAFQSLPDLANSSISAEKIALNVPEDVKVVLDQKCLQCHGSGGSGKARIKWNYEKMSNMQSSKLISKLSKISDEIVEESMPPKKYLKKHPEKKLTIEEKEMINNWANGLAKSLIME